MPEFITIPYRFMPKVIETKPISQMSPYEIQMELRYRRGECKRYQIRYTATIAGKCSTSEINGYAFETSLAQVLETFITEFTADLDDEDSLDRALIQETTELTSPRPSRLSPLTVWNKVKGASNEPN